MTYPKSVSSIPREGSGELSIAGRVRPKTPKMLLDTSLFNTQYVSRIKWSNPGKRVAPSATLWCSSYWKGSLQVTLNYGCQLYLYISINIFQKYFIILSIIFKLNGNSQQTALSRIWNWITNPNSFNVDHYICGTHFSPGLIWIQSWHSLRQAIILGLKSSDCPTIIHSW